MATSAQQRVLNSSLANALRFRGLEEEAVRNIIGILNKAHADLVRKLERRLLRLGPVGQQLPGQGLDTTRRLRRLHDELVVIIRQAYADIGLVAPAELKTFARSVASTEAAALEGALPFQYSATRPSAAVLTSLVVDHPFDGRVLKDWVSKLATDQAAAVRAAIDIGIAQGETVDQIVRRVRGRAVGRHQFEWKGKKRWFVKYEGGLIDTSNRHATAMVRSAYMHVHASAREATHRENDDLIRGYLWDSTLDDRTCKYCQERHGKRYSKGHRPIGHGLPWGNGPGRAHYGGCRCQPIPVLAAAGDVEQALGIELDRGQKAAMNGPVEWPESYDAWLRGQDFETQKLALRSSARARWFRDHSGASIEDAWAQSFRRRRAA